MARILIVEDELCVTKPFSGEQLRAVIEVVLADGAASSPGLGPP